jgi:hypothetical protein
VGFPLYPVLVKRHGGTTMRLKIANILDRVSPEMGIFAIIVGGAALALMIDPAFAQTNSTAAATQAAKTATEVKGLAKAGWTVGLVVVSAITAAGGAVVASKMTRGDTATADWKKWAVGGIAGASAPTLVSVMTGNTPW